MFSGHALLLGLTLELNENRHFCSEKHSTKQGERYCNFLLRFEKPGLEENSDPGTWKKD